MILHIDMDAFYASVEQRDNPALKGKCVIVGGRSRRGVVSAANYEARKMGVHSAMPIFQAKQKCPRGIYLTPRMNRYKEISRRVMALLYAFSPLVEPVSIDEAYMDVRGCERLLGAPAKIAADIKKKIKEHVQLTCSIGVAPIRFLAKIASDMDKPDGLTVIEPEAALEFCRSLPIQKVPGVGQKTDQILRKLGIGTLGDVRGFPSTILYDRLGKYGRRLKELSVCIDPTPVTTGTRYKSVSGEATFDIDTTDKHLLGRAILGHADDVGRQLRRTGAKAKTITLKIKHADFTQATRSTTLAVPTCSSDTIYKEAVRLLHDYHAGKKIRLIGVAASGLDFDGRPLQMSLFQDHGKREIGWERVDRTVDDIQKKFGKDVIGKANLSANRDRHLPRGDSEEKKGEEQFPKK